jgi:hypothetical protein
MTTGGRAGKPKPRPAAEAGATSSGPPAGAAVTGGAVETDPLPAAAEAPADDEAAVRQEIERTREQLGETVGQLAAKTDVKGRAGATAARARAQAAAQAGHVRGQLAGRSAVARQKVAAAGATARTQLQARAAPVQEATPESVRRMVAKGAGTVKQRRAPLAVAALMLIAGYVASRWWRKR